MNDSRRQRKTGQQNTTGYRPAPPLPPDVRQKVVQAFKLPEGRKALHPGLVLDKYVLSVEYSTEKGKGQRWCVPHKLSERVQKPTVQMLAQLSEQPPSGLAFDQLLERRRSTLQALDAVTFQGRTVTPLTLHLARASALENAGLCLHHVYGFAYLPGTGLKGLARSYAETVWLATQFQADADGRPVNEQEREKASQAWQKIEQVFGWSPNSDAGKFWKPEGIKACCDDRSAHVGQVVFHDAWPTEWPRLVADILNCHHRQYYEGNDAPGDWENPVPVYFLAVASGQTFEFALSRRRPDVPEGLVELARQWLVGALTHNAAGAKTNTGYGSFELIEQPAALPASTLQAADATWQQAVQLHRRGEVQWTVELVTPAFLAGAEQYDRTARESCDLRSATLRGLLRWWWRTLHAGFLDVDTLRSLEAALWGDTAASGAIAVDVTPIDKPQVRLFDYKDRFRPKADFKRAHSLGDPPDRKTTQGLFYLSYGMDEVSHKKRWSRCYVEPGAKWRIRLTARPAEFVLDRKKLKDQSSSNQTTQSSRIDVEAVLEQATAALWLLCTYGGVGSKARKGFGSLQLEPTENENQWDLNRCLTVAASLREQLGLSNQFDQQKAESAAWGHPGAGWVQTFESKDGKVPLPSNDVWQVLDHVGYAYQTVAQKYRHNEQKLALGLPRRIHGPRDDGPIRTKDGRAVQDEASWQPAQWLDFPKRPRDLAPWQARHASPVWIHVERTAEGHCVRAVAFPAKYLPNLEQSRQFLSEFLHQFEQELTKPFRPCTDVGQKQQRTGGPQQKPERRKGNGKKTPKPTEKGRRPAAKPKTKAAPKPSAPPLPKPGDLVKAELLEEKTKKGGWKAKHVDTGLSGAVVNTSDVPGDKNPGDVIELIVASVSEQKKEMQFRYPTPQELQRREKGLTKGETKKKPRRR